MDLFEHNQLQSSDDESAVLSEVFIEDLVAIIVKLPIVYFKQRLHIELYYNAGAYFSNALAYSVSNSYLSSD